MRNWHSENIDNDPEIVSLSNKELNRIFNWLVYEDEKEWDKIVNRESKEKSYRIRDTSPETITFRLSIDKDLYDVLKAYSEKLNCTVKKVIQTSIIKGLKEQANKKEIETWITPKK